MAIAQLQAWRSSHDPNEFPYDAVVAEYRRAGKHFVGERLLTALDAVRDQRPDCPRLARFLDTALDKFDRRYDNPSYLALEQLSLPGADGRERDPRAAAAHRDRLLVLLIADMLRFELEAAEGRTDLQPEMRPDRRVTAKRCRHGLRVARPALERLGLTIPVDEADPLVAAGRFCCTVLRSATPAELRTLQLTALPVSLVHDEYMFIRVLQSYETAFSFAAVALSAAIEAIGAGNGQAAARLIGEAETALGESSPLFSLIGTLQPEAFLRFREFTDGASAIQSRNYKRVESLCRRPDQPRLDSPAYESVPEVRDRVVAGQANIDQAILDAHAAGLLSREQCGAVCRAKQGFEEAVLKWRQTHYRIAVRMLGERRGTGYTEGVPYLDEGRRIPVFNGSCPAGYGARTTIGRAEPTTSGRSPGSACARAGSA
jgi:tryptophan 2,3-dioxygenase